jgi:hypothetical protein
MKPASIRVGEAIEHLKRETSPGLISLESWRALGHLAEHSPASADSFGFEIRLDQSSEVDLGLGIKSFGEAFISGPGRTSDPRLRHLRTFGASWNSSLSLRRWVPFVFLEYDAACALDRVPVPSIFVALDAPLDGTCDAPLGAAITAVSILRGQPLGEELESMLKTCFERLGSEGLVLHVGVMLGRKVSGLRLSVLLPGSRVPDYFSEVGSPEAARCADRVLATFPRWLRRAQVDFDFDPRIRSRLGFGVRPHFERKDAWQRLVADLIDAKCCLPEKGLAVLEWPGVSATGRKRYLSHVKLVCDGNSVSAKAYLGVGAGAGEVVGHG